MQWDIRIPAHEGHAHGRCTSTLTGFASRNITTELLPTNWVTSGYEPTVNSMLRMRVGWSYWRVMYLQVCSHSAQLKYLHTWKYRRSAELRSGNKKLHRFICLLLWLTYQTHNLKFAMADSIRTVAFCCTLYVGFVAARDDGLRSPPMVQLLTMISHGSPFRELARTTVVVVWNAALKSHRSYVMGLGHADMPSGLCGAGDFLKTLPSKCCQWHPALSCILMFIFFVCNSHRDGWAGSDTGAKKIV